MQIESASDATIDDVFVRNQYRKLASLCLEVEEERSASRICSVGFLANHANRGEEELG
jgi:hypothetical protein